jgi:4-hydroxy-tetrahydrodipicolinate synthase
MTAGAAGLVSVSAHIAPGIFRELIDAVDAGNLALARQLHFELAPLIRAVMNYAPAAAAAKHILHGRNQLPSSTVRSPLAPLASDETAKMMAELRGTQWARA